RQQAHGGQEQLRLARARFAHHRDAFGRLDLQSHAANRLDALAARLEAHAKILDRQQFRRPRHHVPTSLTSSASRRPSPSILSASSSKASSPPGMSSIQGAASSSPPPSDTNVPRLALGSWMPSPRKLKKLSNSMICGTLKVANTTTTPQTLGRT